MRRGTTTAFLIGCAAALAAHPGDAASAAPADEVRIGLCVDSGSADAPAVAAGVRRALRSAAPGGRTIVWLETNAGAAPHEMRFALADLADRGSEVVVAVGDAVARLAPDVVRDRIVVAIASSATPAVGDRVRVVLDAADPARVADELIRLVAGARRLGVAGPSGGAAEGIVAAARSAVAAGGSVERIRREQGATPFLASALAGADAVVAAPDTPTADVTALVRALAGSGVPVVGTRADHLDAGAAVVIRPAPVDVGALAAAACVDAIEDRGGAGGVRRPRRLVLEVHLANARRLGWQVPLTVLAASDRTVAPPRDRR